jgi:hypothetical protein
MGGIIDTICMFALFVSIYFRSTVIASSAVDLETENLISKTNDCQHTELYLYSGNSLKQQYAGREFTPLGHITLIPSHSSLCFHSVIM